MLLRWEQPKQIAAAYLVFPVAEKVGSGAMRDKIELQFCVMMAAVGARGIVIAPDLTVEIGWKPEVLQHDDKK
jgi:hypothetical protein